MKRTGERGRQVVRYVPRTGVMNVPFGWGFEEGTGRIVENLEEQGVLRLVRELAGSGVSISGIVKRLTEGGVGNRGGGRWSPGTVHRLLHSGELSGKWLERKERLDAEWLQRCEAEEAERRRAAEGEASPLDGCDVVSWGEKWLVNRDESKRTYWGHQVEDLRAEDANIIHLDGRDVGKSVNLVTLALHYAFTSGKGTGLVAAALNGQLMAIWEDVEVQIESNPRLEECVARRRDGQRKMQRVPYPRLELVNGSVLYFRPAGAYGEAFRSLHVERVWVDEGAWLSEEAWRALRQCLKAGGRMRVYSTPNGVRTSTYYRLTGSSRWRVFHWPSWLNPSWSREHEVDLLEFYGGRGTAGWQHEVAGEHGAPSYGAFNAEHFSAALRDVAEYRKVVITGSELEDCGSEREVEERFEALLGIWPDGGVYFVGADLGYTNDPTEILVFKESGIRSQNSEERKTGDRSPETGGRENAENELRLVLRVHMERVGYPQIAGCLGVIDSLLQPAAIGVDNGGNGLAVVQELMSLDRYKRGTRNAECGTEKNNTNYKLSRFSGRLFGFDFGGTSGFELPDGSVVKKRTKEYMTSLINRALQRRELVFPGGDSEIGDQFLTQTYSLNNGVVTYSKGNDHIIDATRCALLGRERASAERAREEEDYSVRPPLPLMCEPFGVPYRVGWWPMRTPGFYEE